GRGSPGRFVGDSRTYRPFWWCLCLRPWLLLGEWRFVGGPYALWRCDGSRGRSGGRVKAGVVVLFGGEADHRGKAVPAGVGDATADHLDAALPRDGELAGQLLPRLVQQVVAKAHLPVGAGAGQRREREAVLGQEWQRNL